MRRLILLAMTALTVCSRAANAQRSARADVAAVSHGDSRVATIDTAALATPALASPSPADAGGGGQPPAADTAPKKKGGLFGKAKGLMKSKVVQTVAKTAACTMVPGGQVLAGAIDAAGSRNAEEAAAGTAGAASGTSCMPGMGAPGLAGAGSARGLNGGMAGLVNPGLASAAAGNTSPSVAAYAPSMATPMTDEQSVAGCMGLSLDEYHALTNPTGGEPRPLTKAEQKRMQQVSRKLDRRRRMACLQAAPTEP
jgi:hypothetical protein